MIDEDGLFALLRASEPFIPAEPLAAATAAPAGGPSSIPASNFFGSTPAGPGAAGAGPSVARRPTLPAGPSAPGPCQPAGGGSLNQLWVDKYKPRSSAELVGNNTLVANLKQWLECWDQVGPYKPIVYRLTGAEGGGGQRWLVKAGRGLAQPSAWDRFVLALPLNSKG